MEDTLPRDFRKIFDPVDFSIWSIDSCKSRVSVAQEDCQLCGYSKRPFYCQRCVTNGKFSKSVRLKKLSPSIENLDYSEVKAKWLNLKSQNITLKNRIELIAKKYEDKKEMTLAILSSKQKVKLLQTVLTYLQAQMKKDNDNYDKIKIDNQKTRQGISLVQAKLTKIKKHLEGLPPRLEKSASISGMKKEELVELRRQYINEVVDYLFPISSYKPNSESTDSLSSSSSPMVSMLKDARITTYMGGRWFYADSGWDQMFKIVEASLPGNGDYAAFIHSRPRFIKGCTNDPSVEIKEDCNSAALWSVSAALSFIAQMVSVCAFILDYGMPYKLHFKVFCEDCLTERNLKKYANRLNRNILHLCLYENVDRRKLQGMHTVVNVLHLVRSPLLGCDAPQDFMTSDPVKFNTDDKDKTDCNENLVDSVFACFTDIDDDEIDDEDDANNASYLPMKSKTIEKDWEYIPATLPDLDLMCQQQQKSTSYFTSSIQQTSSVGNFVSSFWKAAWGGNSDK